jgi:hypothetical protein
LEEQNTALTVQGEHNVLATTHTASGLTSSYTIDVPIPAPGDLAATIYFQELNGKSATIVQKKY